MSDTNVSTETPTPGQVLLEVAQLAQSLPVPMEVQIMRPGRITLRMHDSDPDALDIWAGKLGLAQGERGHVFLDDDGGRRSWFSYRSQGRAYWPGWNVDLWCSVEMSAEEAAELRAERDRAAAAEHAAAEPEPVASGQGDGADLLAFLRKFRKPVSPSRIAEITACLNGYGDSLREALYHSSGIPEVWSVDGPNEDGTATVMLVNGQTIIAWNPADKLWAVTQDAAQAAGV